jgi:hypothetical protein
MHIYRIKYNVATGNKSKRTVWVLISVNGTWRCVRYEWDNRPTAERVNKSSLTQRARSDLDLDISRHGEEE